MPLLCYDLKYFNLAKQQTILNTTYTLVLRDPFELILFAGETERETFEASLGRSGGHLKVMDCSIYKMM